MTNFDKFKSMTIDELAEFIDEHGMYDDTPWMNWWDETYCDKCESIIVKSKDAENILGLTPFLDEEYECAYCEVHNKCKYFPDKDETPSMRDIIKMWLESNI